jgi:hypothetical protein
MCCKDRIASEGKHWAHFDGTVVKTCRFCATQCDVYGDVKSCRNDHEEPPYARWDLRAVHWHYDARLLREERERNLELPSEQAAKELRRSGFYLYQQRRHGWISPLLLWPFVVVLTVGLISLNVHGVVGNWTGWTCFVITLLLAIGYWIVYAGQHHGRWY